MSPGDWLVSAEIADHGPEPFTDTLPPPPPPRPSLRRSSSSTRRDTSSIQPWKSYTKFPAIGHPPAGRDGDTTEVGSTIFDGAFVNVTPIRSPSGVQSMSRDRSFCHCDTFRQVFSDCSGTHAPPTRSANSTG
jgi:hypothetical protein